MRKASSAEFTNAKTTMINFKIVIIYCVLCSIYSIYIQSTSTKVCVVVCVCVWCVSCICVCVWCVYVCENQKPVYIVVLIIWCSSWK
jgi:hypothetical protein